MLQFIYNYFRFTFDRKCLKIFAFSKRDGLNMNGSSIELEKNDTVAICNYCFKDVSVADMEKAALMSHIRGKKHVEKSPFDQCIESIIPPTPVLPLIILKTGLSVDWSFQ